MVSDGVRLTYRRQSQELLASRLWRSSEYQSAISCLSLSTLMVSSGRAHRHCMHSEFYVLTARAIPHCRLSIGLWSSASYCTRPVHGGVSRHRLTDNAWMLSSAVECTQDCPTAAEIADDCDRKLFNNILFSPNHVLHGLLPKATTITTTYTPKTSQQRTAA
jgi:hypothetical protein